MNGNTKDTRAVTPRRDGDLFGRDRFRQGRDKCAVYSGLRSEK